MQQEAAAASMRTGVERHDSSSIVPPHELRALFRLAPGSAAPPHQTGIIRQLLVVDHHLLLVITTRLA
eukprot:3820739-Prymnesium_polylepis.1